MQEEKKYNRKSAIITGAIQVLLVLLVYFLVAWREPFPPIPEYGIELSFGVPDQGRPSASAQPPVQETTPPAEPEPQEEVKEDNSEPDQEVTETEDVNSPDQQEVNESEVSEQEEEQPEAETPEEQPEEVPEETPEEVAPESEEEVQPEPEVTAPVQEEGEESTPDQGQHDTAGQEGDPEAEIDERALYGNVTGEEGASLQLSGWMWDFEPTPYDDSQETGKIVYKITIDDEGYIIGGAIPVTSTVSPTVEKYYRQAVERLTFSKTSTYKPAPTSTGTITFIIKSK